jgi:hypothetical protein
MTEAGEMLETVRISNDPEYLRLVMARAGEAPEVALEACYGWYWAADALLELGASVHLAHPLGVKGFAYRRVKNDERDAADLADLLRMGRLPEAWIAPPASRELRELVRHRAKLVGLRTNLKKLIKSLIVLARVIHVDETSANINGGRWWLHVASTDKLTGYHLHRSRGRQAVTEFGVLPAFGGTVVHDALSVYDGYHQARHALCGAHLSRELVAASEADPDQVWPHQALRALYGLNTAAHQARDQRLPAIPPEIADPLLDSWRHALLVGLTEHRRVQQDTLGHRGRAGDPLYRARRTLRTRTAHAVLASAGVPVTSSGRRQSKTRNLLERAAGARPPPAESAVRGDRSAPAPVGADRRDHLRDRHLRRVGDRAAAHRARLRRGADHPRGGPHPGCGVRGRDRRRTPLPPPRTVDQLGRVDPQTP